MVGRTPKTKKGRRGQRGGEPFAVSEPTRRALAEAFGVVDPRPIQSAAIPKALAGLDVFAKAATGSGKTLAFLVPVVERLAAGGPAPVGGAIRAIVLSPARELAQQTHDVATRLLAFHAGLGAQLVIGGTNKSAEERALASQPCDVLVATPGRLVDHMEVAAFAARLAAVQVLVLDEADRMLDAGFRMSLERIAAVLPPTRQNLFFTATVPDAVKEVARRVMRAGYVSIDVTDGEDAPINPQIAQSYVVAPADQVFPALRALLAAKVAERPDHRIIVFFPTTKLVEFASALFRALGMSILEVHGRLSQPQRTRYTDDFRANAGRVLFASDVAARGVDFPDVTLVLQVGLTDATTYEHRTGRTGRAGKSGEAVILLAHEESPLLRELRPMPASTAFVPPFAPLAPIADAKLAREAEAAFVGQLGFLAAQLGRMRWTKEALVELDRALFRGAGMAGQPTVAPKLLKKMHLDGVPGLAAAPAVAAPAPAPVAAPAVAGPAPVAAPALQFASKTQIM